MGLELPLPRHCRPIVLVPRPTLDTTFPSAQYRRCAAPAPALPTPVSFDAATNVEHQTTICNEANQEDLNMRRGGNRRRRRPGGWGWLESPRVCARVMCQRGCRYGSVPSKGARSGNRYPHGNSQLMSQCPCPCCRVRSPNLARRLTRVPRRGQSTDPIDHCRRARPEAAPGHPRANATPN